MKRKPYPEYKPSGIEWLGGIPINWNFKPIKALFTKKSDKNHADLPLMSVYRDYGVIPTDSRDDNFNKPSLDLSGYQKIVPTDLVTNKMKTWQGSIAISEYEGIVSPAYYTCTAKHNENSRYIHYLLRCEKYISIYITLSKGIRVNQWDLEYEEFREIPILLPSHQEQHAIADYLDRETARIDGLLGKKQRQIELLREKRSALISRAVTKGLDPNAPMKPSGIPWLGDTPSHWEIKPLFSLFKESKLKNTGTLENNVLSLSYGRIVKRDIESNMGLIPESFETYQIVIPGNIILRLTDLQNDKKSLRVGLVREKGIITSAYCCLVSKSIDSLYSSYLLHQYDLLKVFYNFGGGVRQSMNFDDLKRIPIILPSSDEQLAIAEYLDRETARIDVLIQKIEFSMGLLREYRASLISACVTGKIDVREG